MISARNNEDSYTIGMIYSRFHHLTSNNILIRCKYIWLKELHSQFLVFKTSCNFQCIIIRRLFSQGYYDSVTLAI